LLFEEFPILKTPRLIAKLTQACSRRESGKGKFKNKKGILVMPLFLGFKIPALTSTLACHTEFIEV